MWYFNDMFHCMFKAEFVTLVSLKVPSGTLPSLHAHTELRVKLDPVPSRLLPVPLSSPLPSLPPPPVPFAFASDIKSLVSLYSWIELHTFQQGGLYNTEGRPS